MGPEAKIPKGRQLLKSYKGLMLEVGKLSKDEQQPHVGQLLQCNYDSYLKDIYQR